MCACTVHRVLAQPAHRSPSNKLFSPLEAAFAPPLYWNRLLVVALVAAARSFRFSLELFVHCL